MSSRDAKPHFLKSSIRAWIAILLTAPVLLLGVLYFASKWNERLNYNAGISKQFIQRQNTILAYDATAISRRISEILEVSVRDARMLSLIVPTATNFQKFYHAHMGSVSRYDAQSNLLTHVELPLYSELTHLSPTGHEVLRLQHGTMRKTRRLGACELRSLCDRKLIEQMVASPAGTLLFGKLLRWYQKEGEPESNEDALLRVAFSSGSGISVLGIDYRHLKEVLYLPTFPYKEKRKLIDSYHEGNYIYFIDSEKNIIAHPKYWHVMGIDRENGHWVPPIRTDEEDGTHPLNIAAYQGTKLKDYFHRLLTISFIQKGVDIFQAPNLRGTIRVLSVAPIRFLQGQYKKSGIFGHVITGCHVDYFEEPAQKVVPYY